MKYLIISILLLHFGINAIGQKSNVFVEYKYLELTNIQGDIDVIKNNYRNAELVSDSIIINQDDNYINAHFYYELANAYKLGDKYGMWAFSLLRQLILFPNDSLKNGGIQSFTEACSKLDIDREDAVHIYKESAKGINTKNFTARLELLIEQSINLYDKDVEKVLEQYIFQYEKNSPTTSLKIKQWRFLSEISLNIKYKQEIMNNYYSPDAKDVFNNDNKLKKKVLKRINKYDKSTYSLLSFEKLFIQKK